MREDDFKIKAKEADQLDLLPLNLLFDSSFSLCDYML